MSEEPQRIRFPKHHNGGLRGSVVARLLARARELSQRYPAGTPCRFWPETPGDGDGIATRITSTFDPLGEHDFAVRVDGWSGMVSASRIRVDGAAIVPGVHSPASEENADEDVA